MDVFGLALTLYFIIISESKMAGAAGLASPAGANIDKFFMAAMHNVHALHIHETITKNKV